MNAFRKVIIAIAATAALGTTVNSAFAGCYEGYQPSYGTSYDGYSAYDNSNYDDSYGGYDSRGFDHGHFRFEFRGHGHRH
jgi:hypothetical protein